MAASRLVAVEICTRECFRLSDDSSLSNALESLHKRLKGMNLDEGMALIDAEIKNVRNPLFIPHIEVCKGEILRKAGKKVEAALTLRDIAENNLDISSIQYFCGQYLFEVSMFREAIPFLSRCISIEERGPSKWHLEESYLLRAYSYAKLQEHDAARADLDRVQGDDVLFWVQAEPPVCRWSIRQMIGG